MAEKVGGIEYSIDVDSTGAIDASGKVHAVSQQMQRDFTNVDKAVGKLNLKQKEAEKRVGALGRRSGMAGIQLQQFIGQVQGGQSAMVALSQQSADLGFVLGAPLLGAVAGISASLVGMMVPSLSDSATAMQKLDSITEILSKTLGESETGAKVLSRELAKIAERSESLAKIQIASSLQDAAVQMKIAGSGIAEVLQDITKISLKGFNDTIFDAGLSFDDLVNKTHNTSDAIDNLGAGGVARISSLDSAVSSIGRRFDISREQAVSLASAISTFQNDQGPVGIKRLQSALEDLSKQTGFSNKKLNGMTTSLIPLFEAARSGTDITNLLRQALADLDSALESSGNKTKLTAAALMTKELSQQLAVAQLNLEGSTLEAIKLSAAFSLGLKSAEELPKTTQDLLEKLHQVSEQEEANKQAARDASAEKRKILREEAAERKKIEREFTNVRDESAQADDPLKALEQKLAAERQIVADHWAMKLEQEGLSLEQQAALKSEHENTFVNIEAKGKAERDKLALLEKQGKINAVAQTFGALSSLMNTESKKLFEIGKAAALAGAIVDGYAAVVKTMASVPYPFNIPLAAAQAVASAVQVQNIAKQRIGGASSAGATSSFSGGTPATNTQQQQQPNQNITIAGIDRNSLISGGQLIDTLNTALGDGYTINLAGG